MQQKDKVKKFIALTQTGEQTAIFCLQSSDWKLDIASDNYFSNPDMFYRELDVKKIEQMFSRYRDPNDPQKITSDGVVKFLEELQLSPESRLVLIIAWKFRAQAQCEFTRDEFVNGFCDLGVDSLDKLKQKLPQLEIDLNDIHKFKDFYHFTFNYAKDSGQKGLDLDMAIAYWNIVLKDRFKFLDLWCKFLTVSSLALNRTVPSIKTLTCVFRKTIKDPSLKILGTYFLTSPNTSTIRCQIMMLKVHGEKRQCCLM